MSLAHSESTAVFLYTYMDITSQLNYWSSYFFPQNRPSFESIFLSMAKEVSLRSHDAQTKIGCVLVRDNIPLMMGYNGFPRDIDDSVLPNTRPYKYPFMRHAEENAIINCAREGISTKGAEAFITAMPCNECLQRLWQADIKKVYYSKDGVFSFMKDEEFILTQKILLELFKGQMELVAI